MSSHWHCLTISPEFQPGEHQTDCAALSEVSPSRRHARERKFFVLTEDPTSTMKPTGGFATLLLRSMASTKATTKRYQSQTDSAIQSMEQPSSSSCISWTINRYQRHTKRSVISMRMTSLSLVTLLFLLADGTAGADNIPMVPADTSSPRDTLRSFVDACNQYHRLIQTDTFIDRSIGTSDRRLSIALTSPACRLMHASRTHPKLLSVSKRYLIVLSCHPRTRFQGQRKLKRPAALKSCRGIEYRTLESRSLGLNPVPASMNTCSLLALFAGRWTTFRASGRSHIAKRDPKFLSISTTGTCLLQGTPQSPPFWNSFRILCGTNDGGVWLPGNGRDCSSD